MSSTVTFQDVEKKYTLTVKSEFLQDCPNPSELTHQDLNIKHNMFKHFHNENGPAIVRHRDNREEYWLNGVCLHTDPEVAPGTLEKLLHKIQFNKKLESL